MRRNDEGQQSALSNRREEMKLKHAVISIALAAIGFAPLKLAQGQIPAGAQRAMFFVDIKGATQGQFKAENMLVGVHKGGIEGVKFSSAVTSPRDLATGMPSGKRQFSVITFSKLWGPSSPQMIQACTTNESLTVTFEFVKASQGKEIVYQTIKLTGATISSVKRYIDVSMGNEAPDPRELEDVSFTFQKIDITDANGAVVSDNWLAAR
jgi:type VI secretion system secreted protein Hcp